jgi:hypothetical protein
VSEQNGVGCDARKLATRSFAHVSSLVGATVNGDVGDQ